MSGLLFFCVLVLSLGSPALASESCAGLNEQCGDKSCCMHMQCCSHGACCDQPCDDPRCQDPCYAKATADDCLGGTNGDDCVWCVAKDGERFAMCASKDVSQMGVGPTSTLHGWKCFTSKDQEKIPKKSSVREHLLKQ